VEGEQCLNYKDETPLGEIATGTIVISNTDFTALFLLDLGTGQKYELPYLSKNNIMYSAVKVSPNGNMVAYPEGQLIGDGGRTTLWVLDAHAEVLAKIPFDQYLFNLRWLDNERVVLYTNQTAEKGSVLVVNPFTREQSVVSNELPELAVFAWPGVEWGVEYSPDLQAVVFIGSLKVRDSGPVLRDIARDQIIWEPQPPVSSFEMPKWSPDGKRVAEGASGYLYIIDRDGQATAVPKLNPLKGVAHFSWSPDGRYIAVWNSDRPQHYILMVYDLQSEKLMDTCIEDVYPSSPVWSPDSQQIIVNINVNKGEPVLFDIQKEASYLLKSIPKIVYPSDWMNSMP